jgi:uncharacterized protein (DUF2267 family)
MTYRELIKRVQHYSGFSDSESQDALVLFVKNLAARLTPGERKDFASQLPAELKEVAMTTYETSRIKTADSFIQLFSLEEGIDEKHAKKQVMSAWRAIKDTVSEGEIKDIKSQLPTDLAAQLY